MKTLLKNGQIVNVFTDSLVKANLLMEDDRILGWGDYTDADADVVEDVAGKILCPGLIDGHIHIESTMLMPSELAKVCLPRGTTAIVTDPHEVANVCGTAGIDFMMRASRGLPMHVYFMLSSCVPATPFDESGAVLTAAELKPFYARPEVLGLAEMMNYPGVIAGDSDILQKLADCLSCGKVADGHAPGLTGRGLDAYLAAGIESDHECSGEAEAKERISKGQWIMIRQGTAARNLQALLPLFAEPWNRRCLLVTDDRHPADFLAEGHIDHIVRLAARAGENPLVAIRMATLQAAQFFALRHVGALAPGYRADVVVLDSLEDFAVNAVFSAGKKVVENGEVLPFEAPVLPEEVMHSVLSSFNLPELTPADFHLAPESGRCRVIRLIPDQLLTDEVHEEIHWDVENGVDLERDILKLAVVERHKGTGHIGLGFIQGVGLKKGAIASSVSHDSHNLILIGTNEADLAAAANRIREMRGGCVFVVDGEVLAEMALPIAGLMTTVPAAEIAEANRCVREAVYDYGVPRNLAPFMSMAFVSLTVIPSLKMTTQGLVDVNRQERVSLYL